MPDLTWPQVVAQFALAQVRWGLSKFPVVSGRVKADRDRKCQACPHRKNYWCKLCKCLYPLKTAQATSQCPDKPPRWLKFG